MAAPPNSDGRKGLGGWLNAQRQEGLGSWYGLVEGPWLTEEGRKWIRVSTGNLTFLRCLTKRWEMFAEGMGWTEETGDVQSSFCDLVLPISSFESWGTNHMFSGISLTLKLWTIFSLTSWDWKGLGKSEEADGDLGLSYLFSWSSSSSGSQLPLESCCHWPLSSGRFMGPLRTSAALLLVLRRTGPSSGGQPGRHTSLPGEGTKYNYVFLRIVFKIMYHRHN